MNAPTLFGTPVHWPAKLNEIPKDIFDREDIFRLELERIFYGPEWHPVAHTGELPNVGDFKTFDLGRMPLLIVRGKDRLAWLNGLVTCDLATLGQGQDAASGFFVTGTQLQLRGVQPRQGGRRDRAHDGRTSDPVVGTPAANLRVALFLVEAEQRVAVAPGEGVRLEHHHHFARREM